MPVSVAPHITVDRKSFPPHVALIRSLSSVCSDIDVQSARL